MASMPVLSHCNSSITNHIEPESEEKEVLSKPPTLLMQTTGPQSPKKLELTVNIQNENGENHRNASKMSNLVEKEELSLESLNQLNNNALPPFRASLNISPWLKVVIPPGGFKCTDCGDTFLLESSLKHHLERRSVHIQFSCEICLVSLVFYNRCSLLAHMRNHKTKGEKVDISKAAITPLTKELLIGNIASPVVQPGSNGASTCSILLSHLSRETANESGLVGTPGFPKTCKYRCQECFQMFESLDLREEHFGSKMSTPATSSQCSKCPMVCPSKCSLQAHQRIHVRIHPYVCPECGEQNMGSWEKFMNHLYNKCYHFTRHVSYNCFICESTHMSSFNLQTHILKSHTNVYFKCLACPMAFKSPSSFDQHKKSAHKLVEAHCKTIFKCPLCDTVFHSREQLLEHLTIHIREQLGHTKYIFKCSDCLSVFNSKLLLITHTEMAHPKPIFNKNESLGLKSATPTTIFNSNSTSQTSLLVPKIEEGTLTSVSKDEPVNCLICNRIFQNRRSYSVHYKHIHANEGEVSLTCSTCGMTFKDKKLFSSHEQEHAEAKGRYLCLICINNKIRSEEELEGHMKIHANSYRYPRECVSCDDLLGNAEVALNHLVKIHSTALFMVYQCKTCSRKFEDKNLLALHEKEHIEETGSYVCHLCSNNKIKDDEELKLHMEIHVPQYKTFYPINCSKCDIGLENQELAFSHFVEKHVESVNPVTLLENGIKTELEITEEKDDDEMTPKKRTYTCHVCGKTLPKKSHLRRHLNRMHRTIETNKKPIITSTSLPIPETESEEANLPPIKIRIPLQLVKPEEESTTTTNDYSETQRDSNSSSPTTPQILKRNFGLSPVKKLRLYDQESSSDYVCAKCDFTCAKVSDFKEHIMLHKKDTSSLQCPECGTCFVVETSLRKHLVVSHRIPNVEDYLNEAKANAQGLTKDVICNSKTNTWQCRVCCKSFDNEANLKFHIRSHGMAFIRSRPKLPIIPPS